MERQTGTKLSLPPAAPQILERWKSERFRAGRLAGKIEGFREGELRGKRDVLLRLMARAGIALGESERRRVQACSDSATLDRWIDNALGARTAGDVLS